MGKRCRLPLVRLGRFTDDLDLVDAYILAYADTRGIDGVYSFDADLKKKGLRVLKVQ